MSLVDSLLAEFDQEMAVTRTVISRVLDTQLGWKPHAKSMSLGRLTAHVGEVPAWALSILTQPVYDMPAGGYTPAECTSVAATLAAFDTCVARVRSALVGASDASLQETWTFKYGGETRMAMPRAVAWRSFVMNHLIHHRGQLSVYLRQTGSSVPAMYGPSADEAV